MVPPWVGELMDMLIIPSPALRTSVLLKSSMRIYFPLKARRGKPTDSDNSAPSRLPA
jgi:hypothetical protein